MSARVDMVLAIACALGASACTRSAAVEPTSPPPIQPSWHVPQVSAAGLEPLRAAPVIEVTRAAVSIGGERAIDLGGAAASASDPSIAALGDALAPIGAGTTTALAVAPDVSYETFFRVVASAQRAGLRSFEIVVASGDGFAAIPLSLPDTAPAAQDVMSPTDAPVAMVVNVGKSGQTLLWSLSGQEGTLQEPLLQSPRPELAGLQQALVGVRERRPGSSSIVLLLDPAEPFATCAAIMASVRADSSGQPLFDDILLAQPGL